MSAIYMAEPDIEIILKLIHAKATKSGFGLIFTELKKSLTYFYVSDQTFFSKSQLLENHFFLFVNVRYWVHVEDI